MKIKGFFLFVGLLLVSGVSAQVADTVNSSKKSVATFKPKTQAEIMADKVKNYKITRQNLVDVKEAAQPMIKMAGIESDGSDVLIIVNGVKTPYTVYKTIDPKNITSMTIVKDKKGLIEYTAKKSCPALQELFTKKYNKAIIIETKKNEAGK